MQQNNNIQNKSSELAREEAIAKSQQRIAEEEKARREGRPILQVRDRRLPPFWIGLLVTIVPIIGISILSAVLQGLAGYTQNFFWLWWVAFGLEVMVGITAIVLSLRHAGSIASGMWVGFALCILALGTTCFTNLVNSL